MTTSIAQLLPRETAEKLYILAHELERNEQPDDHMSKHNRMVADDYMIAVAATKYKIDVMQALRDLYKGT